jgi:hypothetical protein
MSEKRKRDKNSEGESEPNDRIGPGVSKKRGWPLVGIAIYALDAVATILLFLAGLFYEHHKVPSIWLFFSAVMCFALSAILHWQGKLAAKRRASAWICFSVIVVLVLLATLYWQHRAILQATNAPFSVHIIASLTGAQRDSALFGAVYAGNQVCPVPVALYLEIGNLQSVKTDIVELKVDVRAKKSHWFLPVSWVRGEPVSDAVPLAIPRIPPSESARVTLIGPRLLPFFESHSLEPRQIAKGWILLDMPSAYNNADQPMVLRITVKDAAGEKLAATIPAAGNGENVNWSEVDIGGQIDLTGYSLFHLTR